MAQIELYNKGKNLPKSRMGEKWRLSRTKSLSVKLGTSSKEVYLKQFYFRCSSAAGLRYAVYFITGKLLLINTGYT